MTRPTQEEFEARALSCIEKYNARYADFPAHQVEFLSCDVQERTLQLTHGVTPDELNVYDMLHGGAMAWLADSCAGLTCRAYMDITNCVTVNLSLNYIKAVPKDDPIVIKATLLNEGRKVLHLNMDIHNKDTGTQYCTATALFYVCE